MRVLPQWGIAFQDLEAIFEKAAFIGIVHLAPFLIQCEPLQAFFDDHEISQNELSINMLDIFQRNGFG